MRKMAFVLISLLLSGLACSIGHAAPPGYYGSCVAMDALANLTIGPDGQIDVRFLCEHSGSIDKIVQQYQNVTPGYMGGTGGQIKWELRTDDGTANHFPSTKVLWTATDTNPTKTASGTVIQYFSVAPAVPVTAGTLYHLVYTNVDPNPTVNYVSFDGIYTSKNSSPVQPCYSDDNLMTLWSGPNWQKNLHITPDFNVHYTDGYAQGTGYVDSTSISGPATETFTVSGGNKVVTSVSAAGSNLSFKLSAGATLLASGSGSAAVYPGWQTYQFPSPITLTNGQTYSLVIGGSVGRAVQKGNPYGMYTSFPDGRYTGNSAYDLQFYFSMNQLPAPTNLAILSSTSSQATLGWSAPTGFAPSGYKIYWGTSSGSYTQNVNAGNVTQYTVSGVTAPLYFVVTAYDSAGDESPYSNQVSWTTTSPSSACTYTISPTSQSFGSGGGSGSVSVVANGSSCSWTVSGMPSWIAVLSGNKGAGNGIVTYSVTSNRTGSSRTAGLTIAGRTFTIDQSSSYGGRW